MLKQLAKAELLVLDDFGLTPMSEQTKRDLLEILDDRSDRRSTIVMSQLPVDQWHAYLNDPTLAMPFSTGWCTTVTVSRSKASRCESRKR